MVDVTKGERTIQEIVRQNLCIGCGTCAVLCPKNALKIVECPETGTYQPQLDDSKCNRCGICLKTCPGIEADFNKLNLITFDQRLKYPFVGNFLKCYSGHATDQSVRFKSTSGGLIPALAMFALEIGLADGVLTTRANPEKPLRPHSFVARTKEEVMSAVGSKYCPVPANSALDDILENQGRYIVVGLPCHVQGVRKAQALNKELKDRIPLVFGIVCNHAPTFHAIAYLLKKCKIPEDKIAKLEYRSKGWPGGINITMDDCSEHFIPFNSSYYWGYVFQKFFWSKRCMICNDKLCLLADIIFMDAWLPEFSSDKIGSSLIVVRSKNGADLIAKAMEKGIVELSPVPIEAVLRSQILSKTIARVAARRLALKYSSNRLSTSEILSPNPSVFDLLEAFHLVFINRICKNPSKISDTVIEYHKNVWDLARFAKRMVKRA